MTDAALSIEPRFRDQAVAFDGIGIGRNIDIPSASPLNYHQAISRPVDIAPQAETWIASLRSQ
jgi:hypothetical protein